MFCNNCGFNLNDNSAFCPNCGKMVNMSSQSTERKESSLGILSLVLVFIGCTSFLGLILSITDLVSNAKNKKHTCSYVAITLFVLQVIAIISLMLYGKSLPPRTISENNISQNLVSENTIHEQEEAFPQEETEDAETEIEQIEEEIAESESIDFGMEEPFLQNFIDACESCGINTEQIISVTQIDDWSNGDRYQFCYNDVTHTVYFFDTGEVSSINYAGNSSIKLYEFGYEPLNIDDFEVDLSTYSTLQVSAESVVKTNLNYPDTANFDWWTTGYCNRYYDYYVLGCEFSAQNAFGVEERHVFRIDCVRTGSSFDMVYYELDGVAMMGEPNVPEIERESVEIDTGSEDGEIIIYYGVLGEYGQNDMFDGVPFQRYYIPPGNYIATTQTSGSSFYIETQETHIEDGWETSTIIERVTFSVDNESHEIQINEGECISLTVNSIIVLQPVE